jgi:hypothetical protein
MNKQFEEAAEKYVKENKTFGPVNYVKGEAFLAGCEYAAPKWISVKERTPEFDGRYLCFIEAPQECGNIWRFQETVDLHFNEWITSEDQTVTHWRPLDPNP